jgi:hypothetical protein
MQAPKALNALETLRQAGYSADAQGLQNFSTRMGLIASATAGLIEDPSEAGVRRAFGFLLNPNNKASDYGLGVPQVADAYKAFTDKKTGKILPPEQVRKIAQQYNTQALQSQEALRMHLPQTQQFNTGAQSGQVVTGSAMNPQGFSVANQPGPTTQTVDTRRTLPDGSPNPNFGQPQILGAAPAGPPEVVRTDSKGRPLPPVRQMMEGAQVVSREPPVDARTGKPLMTTQAASTMGGPIPTALPPGQSAAIETATAGPAKASTEAYSKDLTDSRDYATRMNPLKQAIPLLEKSKTGPGSETIQHVKAFAQAMGIPVPNEKSIADYAEAKKYLAQNAASVAPPGTNIPSVLNAFEANPNMQQPKQAAVDLSKMLYGLGRLKQASMLAFQKYGPKLPNGQPDAAQYNEWASKWSPKQDIRGYIADLMTPEQRAALTKSVKPGSPTAQKIKESYLSAKEHDLLGDVEGH